MKPRTSEARDRTTAAPMPAEVEKRLPRRPHGASVTSNVKTRPSVHLHIDELVLHGFAPGDRHPIQEALQAELERLFAERELPPILAHSAEQPHLDAGTFRLAAHSRAGTIGRQIAHTLYQGFQPAPGARLQTRPGGASP